jgi:hypothetical protein
MANLKTDIYEVLDENGNVVDTLRYPEGGSLYKDAAANRKSNVTNTVYRNTGTSGEKYEPLFSSADAAAASSISMDSNGKITVKAPSTALKNPTFQSTLKPALEGISQNYQVNKDYKYALMANSDEKKTSEEWINDFNKDMELLVRQAVEREQAKESIKASTGLDYSDDDVVLRYSVATEYQDANGNTVTVKDDTMQALPKKIREMNLFKNLEGWDEKTQTVSYGDLKKIWKRDMNDDEFREVYREVDAYFQRGDFSNPTEHAAMSAFKDFIDRTNPEVSFFGGMAESIGQAIYGTLTGAASFWAEAFTNLETVFNTIGTQVYGVDGDSSNYKKMNFWSRDVKPAFDSWREQNAADLNRLNKASATTYGITDAVTPIAIGMVTAYGLGQAAAGFAKSGTEKIASKILEKYGAQNTAKDFTTYTISNIVSGAVPAEDVVRNLYASTDLIMRLQSVDNFVKIANTAIMTTETLSNFAGVTSKFADVMAQIITDVCLSDPKMFRQLMESGDDESRAYALNQVTQNVVGEVVGVELGKAIKHIGSSDFVKIANAEISPKIYNIESKIGQTVDNFKTWLHGGDPEWLYKKAKSLGEAADEAVKAGSPKAQSLWNKAGKAERQLKNLAERRVLRQSAREISEFATENPISGSTWDEVIESAQKINAKKVETIAEANNIINRVYTGDVSSLVAKFIQDDDTLKATRNSFLEAQGKVIQVENSLGMGKGFKVFDVETMEKGKTKYTKVTETIRALDPETNAYVLAGYRSNIAQAIVDYSDIPENVQRAKKELAYFDAITKEFEATKPQSLVDAARDMRQKGIKFSEATQDLRVNQRVMSDRELTRMRDSGFFNEGYMRTQRIKDLNDYYSSTGLIKIPELRDTQSFVLGSTREFKDASMVLFDDLNEVARQVNRKQAIDMLKGIGFPIDTVVTGDQSRVISEVNKKARVKFAKDVAANTDSIVKHADSSLYNDFFRHSRAKGDINALETAALKSGASVGAAEKLYPRVGTREARAIIDSEVSTDVARNIIEEKMGHSIYEMSEKQFDDFVSKADKQVKKAFAEALGVDGDVTYDAYSKAMAANPAALTEAEGDVAKVMINRNYDDVWDYGIGGNDLDTLRNHAIDAKRNQEIFFRQTIHKDNVAKLEAARKAYNLEGLADDIDNSLDDFINSAVDVNVNNKTVAEVAESLGDTTANADDLIEYATLESMHKKSGDVKSQFYSRAKKEYERQLRTYYKDKFKGDKEALDKALKNVDKAASELANESSEMLVDKIEQRYGSVAARLRSQGSQIPDQKYFFENVEKLNKEITGISQGPSIVKTYDNGGFAEYVEMSPTVASLFTTMPRQLRVGRFGAMRQEFSRLYRWFVTGGPWPGNLVKQGFRDVGNTLAMGDAWESSAMVEDELTKLFGERFAKEYQENVPDVFETLLKQSEETGEDVGRLIARRELERGAMNVEAELESRLYEFGRASRGMAKRDELYNQKLVDRLRDNLDKATVKLSYLNDLRETSLRKRVFNNNLLKGLKEGMSLQEARTLAEFMQSEATTNFIRQSYHLANLSKTVPYLSSAINGSKSFWRLYAFDPAGVTTRIIGGYVVPVIALTNMSLSNEEDRRIYKQVKEYEKKDNLVFVINGQIISIPIPQEISNFVLPVQHAIEAIQGESSNSYAELAANDLLGSFPVDLSGFVNIDSASLLEEDVFTHNLLPGFSKVAASLLDPVAKSAVIYATGYDPYTLRRVNRSDVNIDSRTGEQRVMGSDESAIAKFLGNAMGDMMSADMAQTLLNNLFGRGGKLVNEGITALYESITNPASMLTNIENLGQKVVEDATNVLSVQRYREESNAAWSRTVSLLYEEKEALLSGNTDESKQYLADKKIVASSDASEDARKAAEGRIRTVEQKFMQKVLDASRNLVEKYDGTFDRYKFATVVSLMNMSSNDVNMLPYNEYASYLSQEEFYINRAAAVETMAKMGFSAPNDGSIFGYFKQNDDGTVSIKYNSPLNILSYSYSSGEQDKMMLAMVRNAVNEAGLWDKHNSIKKQMQAIYGKGKLKNSDYQTIEAIKINWNGEVAKTLAKIVSKYSPEAAINNKQVKDYMKNLIEVPSSWEKNNKGKRVYGKTLGDMGSLKDAYYSTWVNSMFGINDPYKGQF